MGSMSIVVGQSDESAWTAKMPEGLRQPGAATKMLCTRAITVCAALVRSAAVA